MSNDLLDEFDNEDEEMDLLDSIDESDSAEAWVPGTPGEGIQGRVLKVGETRSDFAKDGEDPMVPVVTLELKDGSKVRIIGYGAVLRREILDADPQKGDLFAVKYFGMKEIKKGRWAGKEYKHFGVKTRSA
jgi:hypothetical protein